MSSGVRSSLPGREETGKGRGNSSMIPFAAARQAALSGKATPDQQVELVLAYQQSVGHLASLAFGALWKQYEKYAWRVLLAYWRGSNEQEDMLMAGQISLAQGVKKWRPDGGGNPFTYLSFWVRAGITHHAELFDRYQSFSAASGKEYIFRASFSRGLSPMSAGGIDVVEGAHDFLAMVGQLKDPLMQYVCFRRFVMDETYAEIGKAVGCSRERIRQLEKAALVIIKQNLSEEE